MAEARYIMIGGFLGAGKTTAMLRLAHQLVKEGKTVGLITNDLEGRFSVMENRLHLVPVRFAGNERPRKSLRPQGERLLQGVGLLYIFLQ